jgi:SRSO17 transposase
MNAEKLLSVHDQLNDFLAQFHPHFGRREQRDQLALYARGRLGPLQRKSLEPIALAEGGSPRALQLFLNERVWDEEGVLDLHQRLVAERLGIAEGIFITDGTSDAKKGDQTAGVARQYCGETGKIDNCIVTMHWAYAGRDDLSVLLDGNLYLPPEWSLETGGEEARARREKVGVPEEIGYLNHTQMSIEQLRRIRKNGVAGRWVSGDCEFGHSWEWREEVAQMGLLYVAEIPDTTHGYWRKPRFGVPPKKGDPRGRRPSRSVSDIDKCEVAKVVERRKPTFENWLIREGTKGPDVWRIARMPFWIATERKPGQTQPGILLVAENPLTDERKYFFSNAPANTPTEDLLRVAFSRWRVERCFEDAKGELGLGDAETRSWISLKRHLILTCVLHLFLTLLRSEWGGKYGSADAQPSRRRR